MTSLIDDKELYARQFKTKDNLVGQTINEVVFYLDGTDQDLTEQPNEFGKSLLSGIDFITGSGVFSIGNRYTNLGYGLSIEVGQTNRLEYLDENKKPVSFPTSIQGQVVTDVDIFWMQIPFEGERGLYPQEIEIVTETGYLLLSSLEINDGQISIEFTNELLIIDNKETAMRLKLGQFGIQDNERRYYRDLETFIKAIKNYR